MALMNFTAEDPSTDLEIGKQSSQAQPSSTRLQMMNTLAGLADESPEASLGPRPTMARFVAGMGRARQAMSSSWPARVNQHNSDIAEATRVFISRDDYQSQKEQWRKIQQELRSAIEVVSIKHGEAVSELALKKAELATARAQPTHAGPLATPKATPNTEPIEDSDEEDEQSYVQHTHVVDYTMMTCKQS
ncbi:hypothetical protein DOTSEDRAFT_71533 [Dothistroma septosporum NZE10]|uniref:Uncharacterized protein n=1 Tax=Dothistroma septosporum (strain NZE10 / CBS 128990) TaxID=675120 RepID=N1PR52_DOTSN|nr:hypothetical protein DOTSEDRAFT_71533 [Dothistroma septosporum NZE10]